MLEIFWEGMDNFVAARGHFPLSPVPKSYLQDRAAVFTKAIHDERVRWTIALGLSMKRWLGLHDRRGTFNRCNRWFCITDIRTNTLLNTKRSSRLMVLFCIHMIQLKNEDMNGFFTIVAV